MAEKNDSLDKEQIYEIGFHILPTVPEENVQGIVSKLENLITKNGGVIISQEFPKMRALSYGIKKRIETKYLSFDKAYFGWIKFELLCASVNKIKEEIANIQDVLRFIIIKTVRENTMHIPKSPMVSKDASAEEIKMPKLSGPVEKTEISEAEIDKSIDELLVS